MPDITPCPIHVGYLQCPEKDTCSEFCPHKEPHYPFRRAMHGASVSCRVVDDPYSGGICPGCKPVSKEVMVELMMNCHLCKQPVEEEE